MNCGIDYALLGRRIREYRNRNNLTQEQLAEKLGITVTHLSHIETNNAKISLQTLYRAAQIFDVTINDIIYDDKDVNGIGSITESLKGCNDRQLKIMKETLWTMKKVMNDEDV